MSEQNFPQSNQPIQGSKTIWIIIIVIIATILIVGGGVYAWQKANLERTEQALQQQINLLEDQIKLTQERKNYDSDIVSSLTEIDSDDEIGSDETETDSNKDETVFNEIETASILTPIDQTWNLYTNHEYGFSINVPKKMFHNYGAECEEEVDSYRPKGGIVPVKIFEGENIYISSEYFYELGGETVRDNKHYFSQCDKVINSLANLRDNGYFQQQSWKFVVRDVSNDAELESFIRERYGNGCQLGDKNPSNQPGVFDVSIQGDGRELEETECPLNYMTVLKYHPEKNKAVSWNLGQAFTFVEDESYQNVYDQEMVDSFKFE